MMAQPVGNQDLPSIVYKGFTFPYNPAKTSYKIDRSYVKHKYPELSGNELEDFGANACVISGEGAFFGKDAYTNWRKLLKQYKKKGVGTVSHPIFKDITRGMMVSLTGTVEPTFKYITYTFEIVGDTEPNIKDNKSATYVSDPKPKKHTTKKKKKTNSTAKSNEFVHTVKSGECLSVICYRYAKKYGTTISWQAIAKYNNMKNPNLIYPGDKIKIYYPT